MFGEDLIYVRVTAWAIIIGWVIAGYFVISCTGVA